MILIFEFLLKVKKISFSYSFAALIAEESLIIRFMKKFWILYIILKKIPDCFRNGCVVKPP